MTAAEAPRESPRRLPPPSAAVQALVVAARRRAVLDDDGLRRLAMRAVRAGARDGATLRAWLSGPDCTPRLAERLRELLPPESDAEEAFGPFRLLTHLADGGMGRVWLAGDASERMAVVKTLRPEFGSNREYANRFEREAAITARLDHANLVRGLGHGRTRAGVLWMALEFVPGGDLAALIEGGARLSEAEALLIACQLARALDFAHRLTLIHRDLKPSNVLLGFDGSAKLADFGLARSTSHAHSLHTVQGVAIGSPSFMSPEQIEGRKDLDIRADLYALGCVLHFALLGRPPYCAEEPLEIMRMQVRDDVPDVRVARPELSLRTAKTVLKLMQKDRDQRYQTPGRLVESLEKTLRQLGAEPGRSLAGATIDRSVRRDPAGDGAQLPQATPLPGSGALGTLAAVAGGGLDTLRDGDQPPAPADLERACATPALTLRARGAYAATLVLLARPQAVLGKLRAAPVDLPLRVYPIDVFASECQRVSKSQCRIWSDGAQGARIEDLGSANGTLLDGRVLNPQEPAALSDGRDHHLEIPRALRLTLRVQPQRSKRLAARAGASPPTVGLDSQQAIDVIALRRLDNRPSLGYALVLRRVTIGSAQADIMLQNWSWHDLELGLIDARWLWRPLGQSRWLPVIAGAELGESQLGAESGSYEDFR